MLFSVWPWIVHPYLSTSFCRSGAIRRLAVEKETTSSITYENFVSDIDAGDAFTATLMDILVKVGVSIPSRVLPVI
jgi:hypothetical protein